MKLAGQDDTDIGLDARGQPRADNGNCVLVNGRDCWVQDIWCEGLTEEGELHYEDEEGRWAYGFGMKEFLNAEEDEELQDEVYARVREKVTKREFIDADSVQASLVDVDGKGLKELLFSFREVDEDEEINIDLRIDGVEVAEDD